MDPRTRWHRPEFWLDRLWLVLLIASLRLLDLVALLPRPVLLWAYLRLRMGELWRPPYAMEDEERHAEVYGETPLVVALYLMRKAGVGKGTTLLDVGSGRGLPLLAARYLGAQARGIESVEHHVVASRGALVGAGATVAHGDATQVTWGNPSHVYLAWTCFDPMLRRAVTARVGSLASGARVIALDEPPDLPGLRTVSEHRVPFPWGWVRVWIVEAL